MAAFKHKKSVRSTSTRPQSIADVLPTVGKQLGLEDKVKEWALMSLWPDCVPEAFKATTLPIAVKRQGQQTILMVKTQHSTVASELMFYLPAILAQLNQYQAEIGLHIDAIHIQRG